MVVYPFVMPFLHQSGYNIAGWQGFVNDGFSSAIGQIYGFVTVQPGG